MASMRKPATGFRIAVLAWGMVCCFLGACGSDPLVAGGGPTTGTEAGNAFSARVLRPDGTPVPGASVRARRSASLDDSAAWPSGVTDSDGRVRLVLAPAVDWTLEFAKGDSAGLRRKGAETDSVVDTSVILAPTAGVVGKVKGGVPGSVLSIAGLGRSATLDADTMFRFDDLPADSLVLVAGGGIRSWRLAPAPGSREHVVLDMGGEVGLADPVVALRSLVGSLPGGAVFPIELASPSASDPKASWNDYSLVSEQDDTVLFHLESADTVAGISRLWIRLPERVTGDSLRMRVVAVGSSGRTSPFQASGMGAAILFGYDPLGATSDLAHPGKTVSGISSAAELIADTSFGGKWSMSASYGSDLVRLDSTVLGASNPGTVVARFRLLDPRFGRLWLVQAEDPGTGNRVRVGWGGDSLVFEAGSARLARRLPSDAAAHVVSLQVDADSCRADIDGKIVLALPVDPALKAASPRVVVGRGAGIALKEVLAFQGSQAGPRTALLAGGFRIERRFP